MADDIFVDGVRRDEYICDFMKLHGLARRCTKSIYVIDQSLIDAGRLRLVANADPTASMLAPTQPVISDQVLDLADNTGSASLARNLLK